MSDTFSSVYVLVNQKEWDRIEAWTHGFSKDIIWNQESDEDNKARAEEIFIDQVIFSSNRISSNIIIAYIICLHSIRIVILLIY